jgi:hypothetical protein
MRTTCVAVVVLALAAIADAKAPVTKISVLSQRAIDDTTLKVSAVITKIQASYLPGIKSCYVKVLAKDAAAKGRLDLAFVVSAKGRVTEPTASGLTDAFDKCVKRAMTGWTFAGPKDREKKPSPAHFEIGYDLSTVP